MIRRRNRGTGRWSARVERTEGVSWGRWTASDSWLDSRIFSMGGSRIGCRRRWSDTVPGVRRVGAMPTPSRVGSSSSGHYLRWTFPRTFGLAWTTGSSIWRTGRPFQGLRWGAVPPWLPSCRWRSLSPSLPGLRRSDSRSLPWSFRPWWSPNHRQPPSHRFAPRLPSGGISPPSRKRNSRMASGAILTPFSGNTHRFWDIDEPHLLSVSGSSNSAGNCP